MITDTPERKQLRSKISSLRRQRLNYEAKIALIDREIEAVKANLDAGKIRHGQHIYLSKRNSHDD